MLVITKGAEKRLMKELQRCRAESPTQKCFYLRFSDVELSRQAFFEKFLHLLNEVPNSYMAQVYICHDQDIFILMQGFMQRQFMTFLERLTAEAGISDLSGLSEILEIGLNWGRLEVLCAAKSEMAHKREIETAEKARNEGVEKATLEALSKLDIEKIGDIAQRRRVREEIIIMVADDDQLSRTLVKNVLGRDFLCTQARDGQEALNEYVDCAPDVLFLDIGMPDISGHEVLEHICQIDPDAYVIMFSGRKDEENILRALKAGAQGFVGKPFTREKLFHYIEKSAFVQDKSKGNRGENSPKSAGRN